MASDHNAIIMHDDDQDGDDYDAAEDEHDRDQQHQSLPYTMSRLSICTSKSDYSMYDNMDEYYGQDQEEDMNIYQLYRLPMEEASSDDEDGNTYQKARKELSSDSDIDEHEGGYYSLPATPPGRKTRSPFTQEIDGYLDNEVELRMVEKEYVSENEADHRLVTRKKRNGGSRMSTVLEKARNENKKIMDDNKISEQHKSTNGGGPGGDGGARHHQNSSNNDNMVIWTRPSGGRRYMSMDAEEVKACRELGFEVDLSTTSSHISVSAGSTIGSTTASTSSSGSSAIASWRISSPGDDPKDVKARLKVWAQAVALASASQSRLLN